MPTSPAYFRGASRPTATAPPSPFDDEDDDEAFYDDDEDDLGVILESRILPRFAPVRPAPSLAGDFCWRSLPGPRLPSAEPRSPTE
jgi:hypothetical protein